jgi:hypothetical protein
VDGGQAVDRVWSGGVTWFKVEGGIET